MNEKKNRIYIYIFFILICFILSVMIYQKFHYDGLDGIRDKSPILPTSITPRATSLATPMPLQPDISIIIQPFGFDPAIIPYTQIGDIVEWINNTDAPVVLATDTNSSELFESDAIPPGGVFRYEFTNTGTIFYHIKNNTTLRGTITIAPAPTQDPNAPADFINFTGTTFDPLNIPDATKGDIVEFFNNGAQAIEIVSDSGSPEVFDSGSIPAGGKYDQRFNTLGTYYFHVINHPTLRGSFTILEH